MPARARRPVTLPVVLACAAALLLGACSSVDEPQALDPDVVNLQPGAPGRPNVVLTEAAPDEVFPTSPYTEADVAFMRDMQVHHQQALDMTAMVEARTDHEDLRLFVRRMDISQEGELELLGQMLAAHEAAPGGGAGHSEHDMDDMDGMAMPGMLGEEEMAALEAAEGDEFVRLFLVGMSRHHEGALAMVEDLLATDGTATDPRLSALVQHVDSEQRIEIDRMARMYAELPPA